MTVLSHIAFLASFPAALLAAALAGQTAVDTAATLRTADTAAHTWLALVDKGEIARSWEEGALVLQLGVTKTKWEQLVRSARAPFEPFGTRHQIMARYTTDPPNAPPASMCCCNTRPTSPVVGRWWRRWCRPSTGSGGGGCRGTSSAWSSDPTRQRRSRAGRAGRREDGSMPTVKIGIIGSRFQADCIAAAVRAIPDEAEVVAVA